MERRVKQEGAAYNWIRLQSKADLKTLHLIYFGQTVETLDNMPPDTQKGERQQRIYAPR